MMRNIRLLGWLSNYVAWMGSMIIAFGYPFAGFCVAIIGNALFIVFGYKSGYSSFMFFNVLFLLASIIGLFKWWPW